MLFNKLCLRAGRALILTECTQKQAGRETNKCHWKTKMQGRQETPDFSERKQQVLLMLTAG